MSGLMVQSGERPLLVATVRASSTGVQALFAAPAAGILFVRGWCFTTDGQLELELRTTPGAVRLNIDIINDNGRGPVWLGGEGLPLPSGQGVEANIITAVMVPEYALNVYVSLG